MEKDTKIRDSFPLIKNNSDIAYLDSAASSQKPQVVIDAVNDYSSKSHANIHRGAYKLSLEATDMYDETRKKVAKFIAASSSDEIIFTKGTTDSFNLLAFAYGEENISAGDEVVISILEHHSNILPWQTLCARKGAVLKYLDIDEKGMILKAQINDVISEKTKIVSVTMTSNALGTKQELGDIIKRAHEVGAVVSVDAAQAIPHERVNVKELDCDFLAFSAHKIFGPTGVGVLYGKMEALEKMRPYQTGGDMIEYVELFESTYAPIPTRFEAGTPNIEGVVGFGAAIDFVEELGYETIHRIESDLTSYAYEKISEIEHVNILGTDDLDKRASVISFTVDDVHPHDVTTILDSDGVCVRAGHHCAQPLMKRLGVPSTTRASFSIYNTYEDIDRLCKSLKKVRKWLGYGS